MGWKGDMVTSCSNIKNLISVLETLSPWIKNHVNYLLILWLSLSNSAFMDKVIIYVCLVASVMKLKLYF